MVKTIQAHLELLHDPSRAVAMSAYMRNQFEFLGIPAPLRKAASKQAFTSLGLGKKPLDIDLVQQLGLYLSVNTNMWQSSICTAKSRNSS